MIKNLACCMKLIVLMKTLTTPALMIVYQPSIVHLLYHLQGKMGTIETTNETKYQFVSTTAKIVQS